MAEGRRPFVIFNPASGSGAGGKLQGGYIDLLEDEFGEVKRATTTRAGEEAELADQALADPDVNLIVAVGGDGTWSNVADRILRSERDDVLFGLLASGTGNDFGRNFGLEKRNGTQAVKALSEGRERTVDVGRVNVPMTHVASGTKVEHRYFLNLIGCGFDVAVIEAAKRARFLTGELLYKLTALQQLFRFPGLQFDLESHEPTVSGKHLMLTISNGPFFGGSFPIAPSAEIDDGLLDACAIGDASPLARAKLFGLAEKGRHVEHERVATRRSREFTVRFPAAPRVEVDGDLWEAHSAEVEVEVVPGALKMVAG